MNPSQWDRVRSIFGRMVERPTSARTPREVSGEAFSDPAMKRELDGLLANYRSEDPLFDWANGKDANAAAAPLFQPGQVLASRFRIARFLGRGGMGEVYEAVDTTLHNRAVAIKTVSGEIRHNPDAARRFLREVELAQRVSHPNICRIHEIYPHAWPDPLTGAEHLTQFLTMQLLLGETLSEYFARRGVLPFAEALFLLRQLADALAAAHTAGVIHRDFKPGNVILVDHAGALHPVITDFGVAVRADRSIDSEADQRLNLYSRAGTPEYAAPEQIEGGRITAAVDIYALGVVALEMLTGQTRDRSLKSLSPAHRPAIARCLHPDAAARFASPCDFVQALAGDPLPAHSANWILSRRVLLVGFASTAATVAIGFAAKKILFPSVEIATLSVLPFENDDGAFALPGLQEELTRMFLKSRKLRIIAADSTGFLRPPYDYRKVAAELPADAFLSGVFTASEIQVTLVGRGGAALWERRFDRQRPTYTLHREIQSAVLSVVDAGEADFLMHAGSIPTQDGYLAYVTARSYLTRHSESDLKQAEAFFREAVRHDASYAPAWAGLAYTLLVTEHTEEARATAERALDLDDKCAEAHLVKGLVLHRADWNWDGAQASLQRGLDLEPSNGRAHQWMGGCLSDRGQPARAIQELRAAVDLDPISFNSRIALGICLTHARQFDAAIPRLTQAIAMARQSSAETERPYPFLGACWLMKGELEKAMQNYRRALTLRPGGFIANCHFVFGCASCGHLQEAQAALGRLTRHADAAQNPFYLALAYVGVGDRENAFLYLDRAVAIRDEDAVLIRSHIYLDALRKDPRYPALLARIGLG